MATYADEFTALVRTVRSELNKVHAGYQLTFDTFGWIGNYPIEKGTAAGAARRRRGHGLRLPRRLDEPGRLDRADRRADLRHREHRDGLPRPDPGRPRSSSACPYYGRAWSTDSSAVHATQHLGDQVRAPRRPSSTARPARSPPTTAEVGPGRGRPPGRRLPPPELHGQATAASTRGAQLYYDDAAALGLKYDLVNRDEPARRRDLGPRLRRDADRAVRRAQGQVHHRQDPAGDHAARRSAAPVVSPNGDGRFDSVTTRRGRHRPHPLRLGGPAVLRRHRRPRGPRRRGTPPSARRYTWDGRTNAGAPVPDGPYRITIWTADASNNRASISQGRDRRSAAGRDDPVTRVGLHLARWRRPRGRGPAGDARRPRP